MSDKLQNGSNHEISFGSGGIRFDLSFKPRKRLRISVHPDKTVSVVAPVGKSLEEVLEVVRKRTPWILKQLQYFERFHPLPLPKRFVAGETHYYLGRQYRLKIQEGSQEDVKLKGSFFWVTSREKGDSGRVERLLRRWYREHARSLFERRLAECFEESRVLLGKPLPALRLRRMKRRWGSCSRKGEVLLNTELIKAPLRCVDYVIIHELCHLKYPNHSKGFYRLLSNLMPDWKRWKKRLEQVVI